jgi:hypothetical protein
VTADRRVLDPEALAQPKGLRKVSGCDLHFVPASAKVRDHGPHHDHVRRIREVNPDPHRAAGNNHLTQILIGRPVTII